MMDEAEMLCLSLSLSSLASCVTPWPLPEKLQQGRLSVYGLCARAPLDPFYKKDAAFFFFVAHPDEVEMEERVMVQNYRYVQLLSH
jgi:hypothetical protein